MRFNSYEFLFVFLPATWVVWCLLRRFLGPRWSYGWLTLASLGFYSWWDWRYTPLLLASLLFNYAVGRRLVFAAPSRRRGWLVLGLGWNLGWLAYFKYWNFFAENLNALTPLDLSFAQVVLPLGISFFTFQKIAFLVDASRGRVPATRLADFALFVTFFPQLIAGPIVHHRDFIPQLQDHRRQPLNGRWLALGLALFAAGLFQKCVVADTLAPIADSTFGLAAHGTRLRLVEAWIGVLAYSLQLFYDFAGYSHMALGLGLLFGLKLPVNFLAPYTAGNMIAFWRRWHITLSAFLRDYIYIPLGGNRHGFPRQMFALFFTMAIAGLWHGAGWTFVLWGVWHGATLCLNHLWRRRQMNPAAPPTPIDRAPTWAHALTFLTVTTGWVLFRATDLATVRLLGESLLGIHGMSVPLAWIEWVAPLAPFVRARGVFPNVTASPAALLVLAIALWAALRGPRLLAWLGVSASDVTPGPAWQDAELAPPGQPLTWTRAVAVGVMLAFAIAAISRSSPFLYFQF